MKIRITGTEDELTNTLNAIAALSLKIENI